MVPKRRRNSEDKFDDEDYHPSRRQRLMSPREDSSAERPTLTIEGAASTNILMPTSTFAMELPTFTTLSEYKEPQLNHLGTSALLHADFQEGSSTMPNREHEWVQDHAPRPSRLISLGVNATALPRSGTSLPNVNHYQFHLPSPHSPSPPPLTSIKPSKHRRLEEGDHIPRPPNCFMLFRRAFLRCNPHIPEGVKLGGFVANVWNNLPENEKSVWREEANKRKAEHRIKYPGWRYCPNHSRAKKKRQEKEEAQKRRVAEKYAGPAEQRPIQTGILSSQVRLSGRASSSAGSGQDGVARTLGMNIPSPLPITPTRLRAGYQQYSVVPGEIDVTTSRLVYSPRMPSTPVHEQRISMRLPLSRNTGINDSTEAHDRQAISGADDSDYQATQSAMGTPCLDVGSERHFVPVPCPSRYPLVQVGAELDLNAALAHANSPYVDFEALSTPGLLNSSSELPTPSTLAPSSLPNTPASGFFPSPLVLDSSSFFPLPDYQGEGSSSRQYAEGFWNPSDVDNALSLRFTSDECWSNAIGLGAIDPDLEYLLSIPLEEMQQKLEQDCDAIEGEQEGSASHDKSDASLAAVAVASSEEDGLASNEVKQEGEEGEGDIDAGFLKWFS
ncbi:hypothetical protein VNI00_013986 [Paramarasmius palmivorus]|uniref:HMG box domain-containing protein n=1 Tax=Paramarasmius palmivorus TaxID=297713 RepID=A0AAW0BXU3_9AGAR